MTAVRIAGLNAEMSVDLSAGLVVVVHAMTTSVRLVVKVNAEVAVETNAHRSAGLVVVRHAGAIPATPAATVIARNLVGVNVHPTAQKNAEAPAETDQR